MSVIPLYHRIFLTLRDQIVNGAYDWWSPMPSEQELSAEFGVSRATVRRALGLLQEEGLIHRRQGARTYAKGLGYRATQQRRNLDLVSRDGHFQELFAGNLQQKFSVITPDKEMLRQFAGHRELARVARVRESRGKPFCFVVTFLPLYIANRIPWEALGAQPVISAVQNAGFPHSKVEQVITATLADEDSSTALDTPIGSPLLKVSGLFVDANGITLMRKDGYFMPDSFEYRMTLDSVQQETELSRPTTH